MPGIRFSKFSFQGIGGKHANPRGPFTPLTVANDGARLPWRIRRRAKGVVRDLAFQLRHATMRRRLPVQSAFRSRRT